MEQPCDEMPPDVTEDQTNDDDEINQDYLEFIKITRQHQAKRERQKLLKKKAHEIYYIDIAQVDTVVVANTVEAPDKDGSESNKEDQLIELYGGREAFEKIRAMEMNIDDHFKRKCQELSPHYWPVIPINPKPYLNPILN